MARIETEVVDLDERWRLAAAVMRRLLANGHTKEAWQLVSKMPGDVRTGQLSAFFEGSRLSFDEKLAYLAELDDGMDRSVSIGGILNVPAEDWNAKVDISKIPVTSIYEKNTLSSTIVCELGYLNHLGLKQPGFDSQARSLVNESAKLLVEKRLDLTHFVDILKADISNDGFCHWQDMSALKGKIAAPDYEKVLATVVPSMISKNAGEAMKTVLSDGFAGSSELVVSRSIETYYGADTAGANAWLAANLENQSGPARDLICAGVARVAGADRDFRTANQWVNKIADESLRKKVGDSVAKMSQESPP